MNEPNDEKIERLLKEALAGLPQRHAPVALQRRVLNELARRTELPWWRRSFAQWPMAARTSFVVLCLVLVGLSLSMQFGVQTLSFTQSSIAVAASIGGAASLAFRLIPPVFIYVALSVGAMLYTALFGLGAFAYRTLYLQHSNSTMIRS